MDTDKLKSCSAVHRELIPETIHDTARYANNRAELLHESKWVRERGVRGFKSVAQTQRILTACLSVLAKRSSNVGGANRGSFLFGWLTC